MQLPSLQELLEAGVHFGHDPSRWNPKMAPYIFGARGHVHVIDVQQTLLALEPALAFVRNLASRDGVLLFVGTKRQARALVKKEAGRCGMPYVTTRWLGGTFTNFPTILKSIEKRSLLEEKLGRPDAKLLTKKDRQKMRKEIERLDTVLEGLHNVRKIPDAVFLLGSHDEKLAAKEAQRARVPIIAVVDTNGDPTGIDYVIPGNDDAVRSIALFARLVADAVLKGRAAAVTAAPVVATAPLLTNAPETFIPTLAPAGDPAPAVHP